MNSRKEDREIRLKEYAKELGVSFQGVSDTERFLEAEMVNRIIDAERSQREHRLWIIALISAIASVLSALAAWAAILKYR